MLVGNLYNAGNQQTEPFMNIPTIILTLGCIVFFGTLLVCFVTGRMGHSFEFLLIYVGGGLIVVGALFGITEPKADLKSGVSQDAQVVQTTPIVERLLRGEEVPLVGSTIPQVYATWARDRRLSESDSRKLGDIRRYTIRFNTNDTVQMATNR